MSSTAGEIIVQAFREPNFTPIGHTSTAEEIVEAIPRLNNLINALFGVELGEEFRDWPILTAWPQAQEKHHPLTPTSTEQSTTPWPYPPQNSRLLVTISGADRTIYFPASPTDGARMQFIDVGSTANPILHGYGRLIEGGLTLPGTPSGLDGKKWMYRADQGNWIRLEPITDVDDEIPFPPEFDDLFISGLAIRLAPRFGVTIDPQIVTRYDDMLARVKLRYKESSRPKSAHELRSLARLTPQ
jgi:hypothetical protein